MKRVCNSLSGLLFLLSLVLVLQPLSARAAQIEMEIFYLPHRPALNVVSQVEKVAAEFANVTIRKYDFDDPDSRQLLEKYQLKDHMPVAVFINGKNSFTINGHEMQLRNFPKGDSFVPMFSGEWDYTDLKAILTRLSGEK